MINNLTTAVNSSKLSLNGIVYDTINNLFSSAYDGVARYCSDVKKTITDFATLNLDVGEKLIDDKDFAVSDSFSNVLSPITGIYNIAKDYVSDVGKVIKDFASLNLEVHGDSLSDIVTDERNYKISNAFSNALRTTAIAASSGALGVASYKATAKGLEHGVKGISNAVRKAYGEDVNDDKLEQLHTIDAVASQIGSGLAFGTTAALFGTVGMAKHYLDNKSGYNQKCKEVKKELHKNISLDSENKEKYISLANEEIEKIRTSTSKTIFGKISNVLGIGTGIASGGLLYETAKRGMLTQADAVLKRDSSKLYTKTVESKEKYASKKSINDYEIKDSNDRTDVKEIVHSKSNDNFEVVKPIMDSHDDGNYDKNLKMLTHPDVEVNTNVSEHKSLEDNLSDTQVESWESKFSKLYDKNGKSSIINAEVYDWFADSDADGKADLSRQEIIDKANNLGVNIDDLFYIKDDNGYAKFVSSNEASDELLAIVKASFVGDTKPSTCEEIKPEPVAIVEPKYSTHAWLDAFIKRYSPDKYISNEDVRIYFHDLNDDWFIDKSEQQITSQVLERAKSLGANYNDYLNPEFLKEVPSLDILENIKNHFISKTNIVSYNTDILDSFLKHYNHDSVKKSDWFMKHPVVLEAISKLESDYQNVSDDYVHRADPNINAKFELLEKVHELYIENKSEVEHRAHLDKSKIEFDSRRILNRVHQIGARSLRYYVNGWDSHKEDGKRFNKDFLLPALMSFETNDEIQKDIYTEKGLLVEDVNGQIHTTKEFTAFAKKFGRMTPFALRMLDDIEVVGNGANFTDSQGEYDQDKFKDYMNANLELADFFNSLKDAPQIKNVVDDYVGENGFADSIDEYVNMLELTEDQTHGIYKHKQRNNFLHQIIYKVPMLALYPVAGHFIANDITRVGVLQALSGLRLMRKNHYNPARALEDLLITRPLDSFNFLFNINGKQTVKPSAAQIKLDRLFEQSSHNVTYDTHFLKNAKHILNAKELSSGGSFVSGFVNGASKEARTAAMLEVVNELVVAKKLDSKPFLAFNKLANLVSLGYSVKGTFDYLNNLKEIAPFIEKDPGLIKYLTLY